MPWQCEYKQLVLQGSSLKVSMTLQHNYLVILLQGETNLNSFCGSGLQANTPMNLTISLGTKC